jgi:tRNA1Val (adenine37-N6)-methyltransferase
MKPFKFKQFSVDQDKCAMKIGTDSVLLGSWTSLETNPASALDIGAGTGILSLMLAQRSKSLQIDAVEIDDKAYEQCVDNFENSPWADRLFCYHASLLEFANEMGDRYDLIISNPPYYKENFKSNNEQRDLARFQDALPFDHLIICSARLLSDNGIFSVIIPYKEEKPFINLAAKVHLFPNRILHVKGNPTSKIVRSLIEFSFIESEINIKEITIEKGRHQYTRNYVALTKDFYLRM